MYQSQFLFQRQVLYPFLALGDAGGDQYVSTLGGGDEATALVLPVVGILGGYAVGLAVEEDLMLLGLAQEKHVTESTVSHSADSDAESVSEEVGVLAVHHEAARIVAEVVFPVFQLSVAHEDMVVVVGFKEGRTGRDPCG